VQSGRLRYRVQIQQDQGTLRDTDGAHIPGWVTLMPVWADIEVLSGEELWFARQAQSDVTHRITTRYSSELANLTGSVRVVFGSRVFHLQWAGDPDERRRAWQLHCTEAPDTTAPALPPPDFWAGPFL
jgi:SPP1 family predicted phage head-tail adaptor